MADITLISGSTLGGAEYVAEHLAEKLEEAGFSPPTLPGPLFGDFSSSGVRVVFRPPPRARDLPANPFPFY